MGRYNEGVPIGRHRVYKSWQEHYWALVDKTGDCWLWQGFRDKLGYGNFHDTRMPGKHAKVHRLSYELAFGPLLPSLFVCHHCDNPPCVNPAHLFAGTNADNVSDAVQKGRLKPPPPCIKLTIEQIREIRELCARKLPQKAIAAQFGLHQSQVSKIWRRTNWKSVA